MSYVSNLTRKIVFWNYPRTSWQWDVLCVVILIFIFLTPKSWFENGERRAALAHQSPPASTLLVDAEVIEKPRERGQLEQRLRAFTGRTNLQVLDVHQVAAQA